MELWEKDLLSFRSVTEGSGTERCVELRAFWCGTEVCVKLRDFWYRTEGFWGLKRSGPFVWN